MKGAADRGKGEKTLIAVSGRDILEGSQSRKPSVVGSTRAPWGRILGRSRVCSSA